MTDSENKPDVEKPTLGGMPACWDNRTNWAEWNRLNVLARDNPRKALDHYCTDCSPEFKQKMVEAKRCAHPTVTFINIIERQHEPRLHARRDVKTAALRGVRHDKA
jgi:hypothetical protein